MLEEAIAKIKSGQMEGLNEIDDQWAPQINLGVPVLIPEKYVPDLDVRLGLYRRLSGLSGKVESLRLDRSFDRKSVAWTSKQ
jgi:transcription-repair coupling factor (superfamily II helicase)